MSERPPSVDPTEWEFLQTLERRRAQMDAIAWSVPGLAVAAEAFLLTIALRSDTEPLGRLLACAAGVVILFAALRLMWKAMFNFDLVDGAINYQRGVLRLQGVRTRDDLLPLVDKFPCNESVRSRRYRERWLRRVLVIETSSIMAWIWTLRALVVLDLAIAVYAIVEWAGADPGWLSGG